MMIKTDGNGESGMQQVAASSQIPPASAASGDVPHRKRVTLALRYGTTDDECQWVLMYPTKGTDPATDTFSTAGMSSEDITKRVALGALEKIITSGLHYSFLNIEQQELRHQVESVQEVIPTLWITHTTDPLGAKLDRKAQTVIGKWQQRHEPVAEETRGGSIRGRTTRRTSERTVYVNISYERSKREFGIGYVVKDIFLNTDTGEETWNLRFFSSLSLLPVRGNENVAHLRAILRALSGRNVVSQGIKTNVRSLVIYSPDREAVTLLTALRHGDPSEGNRADLMQEPAMRVIALMRGVKGVQFKVCDENDMLNEAAGRLALATRRNEEFGISGAPARDIKLQIVSDTLETLESMGIATRLGEVSIDSEHLSGSLPPSERSDNSQ